jgi:hypothetical protein
MIVEISYLMDYVRGLDERLRDEDKYPHEEILNKIRYGIHNLAAQVQCFTKEEQVKLNDYTDTGLNQFNIYPTKPNVLGYYNKTVMIDNGGIIEDVFYTDIVVKENPDKSLYVTIPSPPYQDLYLSLKYFYAPDVTFTSQIDIEPEVFHFMKHSVQIVVWGALKDYEKEQYHQKVLDTHASQKILQMPQSMVPSSMKGGFV